MTNIWILLIIVIALTFFTYLLSECDLLCPACLLCYAFILSIVFAIYNCYNWEYDIHVDTIYLLTLGLLSFSVPALVAKYIVDANKESGNLILYSKYIEVPKWLTILICIYGAVISYIYIRSITSVIGTSSSWSDVMGSYRYQLSYGDVSATKLPTWVTYSFRAFMAAAYVYLFIVINNYITFKRISLINTIPEVMYCVSSLAQASRGQVVVFLITGVIMGWCIRGITTYDGTRLPFKYVVFAVLGIILFFFTFVTLNDFVGRITTKSPLDSLATYAGGSILSFDMFLLDPGPRVVSDSLWGSETFQGLYSSFGRYLGKQEWQYTFQLEYRYIGLINIGNLYTAFRYYYHDFGIFGMCALTAIQGFMFSYVYELLIRTKKLSSPYGLIVFSYYGVSIAYFPLTDWLFRTYLNPPALIYLVLLYVVMRVILSKAYIYDQNNASLT